MLRSSTLRKTPSRANAAAAIACIVLLSPAGCTPALRGLFGSPSSAPNLAAESNAQSAADDADPVATADVALVVNKQRQTLEVYRFGNLAREYPVTVGSRPRGRKRYEGDMRTPEGLYRITRKRTHVRWRYFLEIDYPNEKDLERYEAELAEDTIPVIGSKKPGIGGSLGIHGNDRPHEQAAGRNWTRGCVAMRNADIIHLYELVEPGTPVLFLP